jgi:hypothetical protein
MSLPEPVRFFVLPVMVGLIGAVLSAFIKILMDRSESTRSHRDLQMGKAIEISKDVIVSMDQVYACLSYDVWHVAWRRRMGRYKASRGEEVDADPDLLASDKEHWQVYQTTLAAWRSKGLHYETELKASFGEDGYEALLFARASRLLDQAADTLREIYYYDYNKKGTGVSSTSDDNGEHMKMLMAERKRASRKEFDVFLEDIRGKIKMLSSTMIYCIQKEAVGTLRSKAPTDDDIPDGAGTTTMAMLKAEAKMSSANSTKKGEQYL